MKISKMKKFIKLNSSILHSEFSILKTCFSYKSNKNDYYSIKMRIKQFSENKNSQFKINSLDKEILSDKIQDKEQQIADNSKFTNQGFCSDILKNTKNSNEDLLINNTNNNVNISILHRFFYDRKKLIKDLLEITKFRLSTLNSIVAISTFLLNSATFNTFNFVNFTLGTMLISMTTQVLNQVKEKDFDINMIRTKNRPMPKEKFTKFQGLMIASFLNLGSMFFYSNLPLGMGIIAFSNLILLTYILVYTPLKRINNLSMHVGAIVGALPALLGSIASLGFFSYNSILLALYIYFWQYPHFYGILYPNRKDYENAGFKFISSDTTKDHIAKKQMIIALIGMLLTVLLMYKEGIIQNIELSIFITTFIYKLPAIHNFLNNPIKYGKIIRIRSYIPFLIVLFSYIKTSLK